MYNNLEIERYGTVAELWLNRPAKMNALSRDTLDEIASACHDLDRDGELRVLIVGGRGRCFSAGADLSGFPGPGSEGAREAADAGRRMADALEGMKAVSIARIHNWCVGGGLVLAAACDLRIATVDARFSIPEIDLGIPLAWGGIPRLVREIGPALTKELVMTCRPFDAPEARSAGFLNDVVAVDELDGRVRELAKSLAAKPRFPIQATKQHVDAITSQQVGLQRAWSDADGLLTGLTDPECGMAREAYLKSIGRA